MTKEPDYDWYLEQIELEKLNMKRSEERIVSLAYDAQKLIPVSLEELVAKKEDLTIRLGECAHRLEESCIESDRISDEYDKLDKELNKVLYQIDLFTQKQS